MQKTQTLHENCTTFTERPFTPRKSQEKPRPKGVATVQEEEEEPKDLVEEMEELTVGKVIVEDF